MSVSHYNHSFERLSPQSLAKWHGVGAAETSDCLGRGMAMHGAISPLAPSMTLLGQARAVGCMVADNSALHAAITLAQPGDVLVAAAQGFEDIAVWGGLMTRAAMQKGIVGLVVDGAIRDSGEIIELGFSCYARVSVPRGPHKGFGGTVDKPISCAGVPVSSGDLVIGDSDGITIVPLAKIDETLEAVRDLMNREQATIKKLETGDTLAEIYGIPQIETINE